MENTEAVFSQLMVFPTFVLWLFTLLLLSEAGCAPYPSHLTPGSTPAVHALEWFYHFSLESGGGLLALENQISLFI